MNRHALEQGFQGAGYFASCYQIAIQLIEVAGILTQGSGQGVAAGNVLFQRLHQFAQLQVFDAFADDVEGLQQRDAGFEQGG